MGMVLKNIEYMNGGLVKISASVPKSIGRARGGGRGSKFDQAPTLCHIPMTLKNMNLISYIYISTLICVPFIDDTQKFISFLLQNELI
jgi:hypothetical protein